MHASVLILAPEGRPARSVVKHTSRTIICAYSRFSVKGWGEICEEASRDFSLQLCNRLLKEDAESVFDYGELSQAAFAEISARYKTPYPEWISCEFVALYFHEDKAKLFWIGDVHGNIKINGISVARVYPHIALTTSPFGGQIGIVTNYLSFQQDAGVTMKYAVHSPQSGQVFAWIGSSLLNDSIENDLNRMLLSASHHQVVSQVSHASVGEFQGIAIIL